VSKDEPVGKETGLAEQRSVAGTQVKKSVYELWKKKQAIQGNYKDVIRLCREKIRRTKAQLELFLMTGVKDNKKMFLQMLATKGGLRRISILYWMQGET